MTAAACPGRSADTPPPPQPAPGRVAPGVAATATPTFLFGMERSGTTMLSMIIGAHPLVAVPLATTGMWTDFARGLPRGFHDLATGDDVVRLEIGKSTLRKHRHSCATSSTTSALKNK